MNLFNTLESATRILGMAMLFTLTWTILPTYLHAQPPAERPDAKDDAQPSDELSKEERNSLDRRASALGKQAFGLYQSGNLAAARDCLEQALKITQRIYPGDHPKVAAFSGNMGNVFYAEGKIAEALGYYKQALAMNQRLFPDENHPAVATSLYNVGLMLQEQRKLAEALDNYRKSLDMYKQLYPNQDHYSVAEILNNMGVLFKNLGEYGEALGYSRQSVEMFRRLFPNQDHRYLAHSLNNTGDMLRELGEYGQALDFFRLALEMRRRLYPDQDHVEVADSLNNIGVVLQAQDRHKEALAYYDRTQEMYERLYPDQDHVDLANILNNKGFTLQDLHNDPDALDNYRRALEMYKRLSPDQDDYHVAKILNNIGYVLQNQGNYTSALRYHRQALEMKRRLYPAEQYRYGHLDLLTGLSHLGIVLRELGEEGQALPLFQSAIAMQQGLAAAFLTGASEAEALNFQEHLAVSQAHVQDHLLTIGRNCPAVANSLYSSVWGGKAVVFRMVQQRQRALSRTEDAATLAIAHDLIAVRHQLAGLLVAPADPSSKVDNGVQHITERKEQLERRLGDRLSQFRRQLALAQRPATDLGRLLPRGTVFIDFLLYMNVQQDPQVPGATGLRLTPSFVAFVVRPGQDTTTAFLGPALPIVRAVHDWYVQIQDNSKSDGESANLRRALRALIWEKLEPLFPPGTGTVLISPDAALTRLPWTALPGRSPDSVLLDDYALAVIPSGLFLLDRLTAERKPEKGPVGEFLAVGDVSYDETPPASAPMAGVLEIRPAATVGDRSGVWPSLESTRPELTSIVGQAGTRTVHMLTSNKASTGAVLSALPRARWAHLATHGFFADSTFRSYSHMDETQFRRASAGIATDRIQAGSRSPLVRSGLVLAGANFPRPKDALGVPQGDGGILTAEAIAGLSLQDLELVVLSACETSLGEVAVGEGVFGLHRAFHTAGAHDVVASLWRVKSGATTALMKLFYYKLWAESKPPIVALREAQLELYRHPERIQGLAVDRAPDFNKTETIVEEKAGSSPSGHAPTRLWAGFILSGLGR